jgi:Trypsin-like peptidase domain
MAKRRAAPGAADPVVAASAAATRAVVQIGRHGGRGFIIVVGERRYVVTAAHCIFDKLPVPHPARDSNEVTYRNLIGPLGGKRRVSAECAFLDPIADIAVFGSPDTQDRYEEAQAYEELTGEMAFKIGKLSLPRQRSRTRSMTVNGKRRPIKLKTPPGSANSEARMLSLDGDWFTCRLTSNGGPLWFDQAAQPVISGMSGSPIVLPDGAAVGVVCVSENGHSSGRTGGPNPMLAAHLPGWLLEQR